MALAQNFLYLHLTPAYAQRVWVIIDAGEREQRVIERLRRDFNSWPPEHFDQFREHDFERYYPACFQDEVEEILKPAHGDEAKKKKQERKSKLREKVMKWIEEEDTDRVKEAFLSSAGEVIAKLKTIESKLAANTRAK